MKTAKKDSNQNLSSIRKGKVYKQCDRYMENHNK